MSKAMGWILLVAGLGLAGYGVALLSGAALPTGGVNYAIVGSLGLGLGLLLLVIALVFLTRQPKMGPAAVEAPPLAAPETVEVKRTEMRWAERPAAQEGEVTTEIEGVRQQLARLKVQYGLGEISNESYRRLSAELEAKLAELERAEYESR